MLLDKAAALTAGLLENLKNQEIERCVFDLKGQNDGRKRCVLGSRDLVQVPCRPRAPRSGPEGATGWTSGRWPRPVIELQPRRVSVINVRRLIALGMRDSVLWNENM